MEVDIRPTRRVIVLGLDRRRPEDLGFCAITFGVNHLFWVNGYILCLEVYEKSFEHEIEKGDFYISQLCYAESKEYKRLLEVEKGAQIPVVNVSDMQMYRKLIEAISRLNR